MASEPLRDPAVGQALVRALLERAGHARIEVVSLTDEELALLDGPGADHVAPLPWFDTVPPEQRDTALAVAARNLVVRGLALPAFPHESTGSVSVALPDDVHAVLAARRAASTVLIAQRRTAEASATRVLYVQGDDGVVEEHVTSGGLHTFTAGSPEAALRELTGFVDPDGAATHDGIPVELELSDVASGAVAAGPLAESRYVTVVWVTTLGPAGEPVERRLSLYALPERLDIAEPLADRAVLAVRAVGPGSLLNALRQTLCGSDAA